MLNALPNSLESEQSLIGGMLINPSIIPMVVQKIEIEDLDYNKHRELYRAILKAPSKDATTVWNEINKDKVDKKYFMDLMTVTTSAAWEYHVDIIKKASNKRKLWAIGTELREQAALNNTDYAELISNVKNQILSIEKQIESDDYDNSTHYMKLYNSLTETKTPGLYSGIPLIDEKFYFEKEYIHCIAAESGIGKSSFALKIADNMAWQYGNVDYYTFESNKNRLGARNIARMSNVALTRINKNNFTGYEQERKIEDAILKSCESRLYFFDNPKYTEIEKLVSHAESRALKYKTAAIFVDYLQLAQSINKRLLDRKSLVENALLKFKALAKNLNIPVIYICQLRKDIEGRPSLDDLYESNAIRQATDNIIFLWSPLPIMERPEKHKYNIEAYALKCKDQNLWAEWFEFDGNFQEFTPCYKPDHFSLKEKVYLSRSQKIPSTIPAIEYFLIQTIGPLIAFSYPLLILRLVVK